MTHLVISEYWRRLLRAQSWTHPFLRDLYEWNKGIISLVAIWNHNEQGAFHSAQNFGNACQESNITDHFGTVRPEYLGPDLWRWFMHFDRNVPHHLTTIVAPCTSPLYPVYEYNNQTRGGLGRVCSTGMYLSVGNFRNFNTNFLLNVKPPKSLHSTPIPHPGANISVESLLACQWLVCSSYFIKCFMFLASRIIVPR